MQGLTSLAFGLKSLQAKGEAMLLYFNNTKEMVLNCSYNFIIT